MLDPLLYSIPYEKLPPLVFKVTLPGGCTLDDRVMSKQVCIMDFFYKTVNKAD